MKKLKIILTLFALISTNFFACQKNETINVPEPSSPIKLDLKNYNNLSTAKVEQQIMENFQTLAGLDLGNTIMPQTEQEAASILATLQANSTVKIKSNLGLSDADMIEVFGSLDDSGIAQFGLILTSLETIEPSAINPWDICNQQNVYVKCLLETLLPCDAIAALKKMIDDGLSQPGSAISAGAFYTAWAAYSAAERKVILKSIVTMAKRSFGFLAVMVMAYDFTVCLINNGSEIGDPPGSGTFTAIDFDSYLIPTPLPIEGIYFSPTGQEITQNTPLFHTLIFFNSADSKYYTTSSFSTLVPDGFYKFTHSVLGEIYYKIVNGESIMAYQYGI
jgi:hypothetical protein